MEARGHNGQVHFDGQFVTIARRGFIARSTIGKGEKRIPLVQITALQWKPATRLINGFIQFTIAGGIEARSRFGHQGSDAARDENSVVFMHKQMPAFEQLRAEIDGALARLHGQAVSQMRGVPIAGPRGSAAERLRELADLHTQRLISDQEFTARRAEILREI
jgi:hypothetical protein